MVVDRRLRAPMVVDRRLRAPMVVDRRLRAPMVVVRRLRAPMVVVRRFTLRRLTLRRLPKPPSETLVGGGSAAIVGADELYGVHGDGKRPVLLNPRTPPRPSGQNSYPIDWLSGGLPPLPNPDRRPAQ